MLANEMTINHVDVTHITIACRLAFDEVHSSVVINVPTLDPALLEALEINDADKIAALRMSGPHLWLFLTRDHGSLIGGRKRQPKAHQYEIGNPLTAVRMTNERLAAALYAPLRVVLWEADDGKAFFEYDQPSSLLGQFQNERVRRVAGELDRELEDVLMRSAGNL